MFCTEALRKQLGVSGPRTKISLTTLEKKDSLVDSIIVEDLTISDLNKNVFIKLPILYTRPSIPVARENIPSQHDVDKWPHLSGVHLPRVDAEVGLLIASDVPAVLDPLEVKHSEGGGPYTSRTRVEWAVNGPLVPYPHCSHPSSFFVKADTELHRMVQDFYNRDFSESIADNHTELSQEEHLFIESVQKSVELKNGHYKIALPFKDVQRPVIPLPKDGDHEIPNNNRPVSLLPAASKICERVALNQLMTYMTTKRRLSEHQSGNKKLHSCGTLNVMITDKALEAMDAKKVTLVVLLDLSRAFDSIDHATLLAKLQALGVSRASLDWFKSYLSGRLQCVRIGAETSSLQGISHGVPQGSILGPALFTIYLNNIPSIPDVCSLESYVDDSKLYLSFPVAEASNVIQQINKDLKKIASWCCYNSLLINPEKTKLLVLGTRQMLQTLPADFHVTLLGKKITPSPSARDLGLQVDSILSYDEHVTQTVSSCIDSLCQINRVKHLFDARALERVINALVFSKLYYCSPVWSNTSKKNISKLQKVQNFACRIITGKRKFDHITPILRELRWLPVISFLKYTLGVLAFKCVKGLAPSYLCRRFKTRTSVHNRNTRYKNTLNVPAYKSASGQRTFLYRATSFWNSLPCEIRECNNLPIFQKILKEFLTSF